MNVSSNVQGLPPDVRYTEFETIKSIMMDALSDMASEQYNQEGTELQCLEQYWLSQQSSVTGK